MRGAEVSSRDIHSDFHPAAQGEQLLAEVKVIAVRAFRPTQLTQAGMIKSRPQKIIAQPADWRFVNQLKKELKT